MVGEGMVGLCRQGIGWMITQISDSRVNTNQTNRNSEMENNPFQSHNIVSATTQIKTVRKNSPLKAIISVFITGGANCPQLHSPSVTKNISGLEMGHFVI
jgi:serine/threonine protein phosphatase PrpC